MLTVGVLGTVQARRDDVVLPVPAGLTSELLARLALEAGSHVRADVLLEDLWGEPTSRNTLQSKVSQLRRALGGRDEVLGSGDGYTLAVARDAVDAVRAPALARAAVEARAGGDPAAALAVATEGLDLFRGEVLLDAGDWAKPYRARLEEVRQQLHEVALRSRVELGAGAELVPELEGLVEAHPLREGLWVCLITALYRGGRQADALAAHARVRTLLREELGIDPGPELQQLERDVLTQRAGPAQGAERLQQPGNLPCLPGGMVGREGRVAELVAALEHRQLVSVLGPAGVGKSRLALEVAHRVEAPGGVWWVRLDAVDAIAPVGPEGARVDLALLVAETLHVPGGKAGLVERLTGARTVLVLDGCEHLAAAVADFVSGALDRVSYLAVLVTSQVALGLPQEQVEPLAPLDHEEAVVLFGRRATAARPRALEGGAATLVDDLCRALDGLPLAIELAAARVRSMSLQDLARRLDDRLEVLRDPSSSAPERRRTLAAAIAWSYDLLFPDDQHTLWAVATFAGSASLDAVQHVARALGVPASSTLDSVSRLVDRSLVTVAEGPDGGVRYRLLDSIRAYAVARLDDSGDSRVAAAAHAGWYAEVAAGCDARVRTAEQPDCLGLVREERADVDAALAWCESHDPVLGLEIANGLAWAWVVLADGTAGAARLRVAVRAAQERTGPGPGAATAAAVAQAWSVAAWLEASAGDLVLAQADLDAATAVVETVDDALLVADLQRHRAFVRIQQGRAPDVLTDAVASVMATRPLAMPWRTAAGLLLAAYGSLMSGEAAVARRDAEEALALLQPLGDAWGLVHAQAMLGGIAQAEGRGGDAAVALAAAADASETLGFPGQAALHRATLARVQHRAGDSAADASYRRAIDEARAGGDGRLLCQARLHRALLLRSHGDASGASALLEENARWYAAAGGGDFALANRALAASLRDDPGDLASTAAEAGREGDRVAALFAVDALARLRAEAGEPEVARDLLAEADVLAGSVGHLVDDADRVDADAARSALRALC